MTDSQRFDSSSILVAVGIVRRPHGVTGEISVAPRFDGDPAALVGLRLLPDPPIASSNPGAICESIRTHAKGWLVRLSGIESPEAAQAWRGRALLAESSRLPASEAGSPYHFELIGRKVVDVDGRAIGDVRRIEESPAGDLLVLDDAGDVLIPFRAMVVRLEPDGGPIVVDLPEGLLDVNRRK